MINIAIIGGGAAGCFCAIELKRKLPYANVNIYEGAKLPMQKLSITGGGKCNLTNTFEYASDLSKIYPRGFRLMKRLLAKFDAKATMDWFEREGIRLIIREDCCVFPASLDAMQIVRALKTAIKAEEINIYTEHRLTSISKEITGYKLFFQNTETTADIVIIATGGLGKAGTLIYKNLDLEIIPPLPSLFTFNLPNDTITKLSGLSSNNVIVSITGTKYKAEGSILVTHFGVSGPAILKLSAYASRYLADSGYSAVLSINWAGNMNESEIRQTMLDISSNYPQKYLRTIHPDFIPAGIWNHILDTINIRKDIRWAETGTKTINKIISTITNDIHQINGKNRHKDEFVTCGGISISNIDLNTLQAKKYPGLYFVGEALDIDAVTGGFNLQAAWTTAYTVALAITNVTQDNSQHQAF